MQLRYLTALEERGLMKEATVTGAVPSGFRDLLAAPFETSPSSDSTFMTQGAATQPVLRGAGKTPSTEHLRPQEEVLSEGLVHV